jgi:hypothetical protein
MLKRNQIRANNQIIEFTLSADLEILQPKMHSLLFLDPTATLSQALWIFSSFTEDVVKSAYAAAKNKRAELDK